MDKDVVEALDFWRIMNGYKRTWAKFDATPYGVDVHVGTVHSDGTIERTRLTRTYYLMKNGEANFYDNVHT